MDIKHPKTIKEAAEIFKKASAARIPVIPAGAMTRLRVDFPALTSQEVLLVSTRDLKKISRLEPNNLLAIAEAGVTPDELNEALKPTGLYWPITGLGSRTLGAIMAEGALGLESMAKGSMVDWILGSTFIAPDGRVVSSGGRTLKNVCGYDFTRLAWRSRGRLGLCASFILKLLPLPISAPVIEIKMKGPAQAAELASRIIRQRLWPEGLRIVCQYESVSLLVWLAGFQQVTEEKCRRLTELSGRNKMIIHQDGWAYWQDHGRRWSADDPCLTTVLGSRQTILSLARTIDEGVGGGIQRADLDVGGGRATLSLAHGLSADEVVAWVPGLLPDRFASSGAVYETVKQGLDPQQIVFPDSLLEGYVPGPVC